MSQTRAPGVEGNADKKQGEERQLAQVLERLKLKPQSTESSEKPDFLLTFGDPAEVLVGCELTRFDGTKGGSTTASFRQFALWRELNRTMLSLQRSSPTADVGGTLFFKNSEFKHLRRIIGMGLATELLAIVPALGRQQQSLDVRSFASDSLLDKHVEMVRMHRRPLALRTAASTRSQVSAQHGWWFAHLQSGGIIDPVAALKSILAEKRAKSRGYDWRGAQHRWLVVVAEALGLDDACIIVNPIDSALLGPHEPFSKVIVWDCFFERVHEISPQFGLLSDGMSKRVFLRHYPNALRRFVTV